MRHPARLPGALLLLALGILLAPAPGRAAVPLGGLAVAVTADGGRLVAGGDSRAIYELDPASLEVKGRTYLGRSIVALAFSPDGKRLWVESTKAVQMLDAASLKVLATIEEVERMSVAAAAGRVAVLSRRPAEVRILSLDDGSVQGQVPYDRMQSVAAFGLKPDGSKLALLYYRKRSDEEPKVGYKDIPKELKGADLNAFKQRHDGYRAQYVVHDLAAGKTVLDKRLWYGAPSGGNRIAWQGDTVSVVSYENQNARIAPDGEVTYFELASGHNYGLGFSADGTVALAGGLRDGSRTSLVDGKGTTFQLERGPGFPEYWKSFSLAADGTGYGGTSAWQVARIDAQGKLVRLRPVH